MSKIKLYFTKNYAIICIIPIYTIILLIRYFVMTYVNNLQNFLFWDDDNLYQKEIDKLLFQAIFAMLLFIIITILFLTLVYYYFKTHTYTFKFMFFIVCFINTHILLFIMKLSLAIHLEKNGSTISETIDSAAIFILLIEILWLLCFAYFFDRIKNIRL